MFLLFVFAIRQFLILLINCLICFHFSFLTHAHFMIQLFTILNLYLSRMIHSNFISFHFNSLLSRNEHYNDYCFVDWRILLNYVENFFQFDLIFSELHFREIYIIDNLILRRIWNIDDLIFHVRSLIICQKKFKLTYCSFFLQRITKNFKIIINEYKVH